MARPGARAARRGAPARRRPRRRRALFAEALRAAAPRSATPTRSSSASPSSPCWPWTRAMGRGGRSTSSAALAAIDEHRMHDYVAPCSPSPPRPGSRCTGATWTRRTVSSRGRCGPVRRARMRPHGSPCGCGCSWRRCLGARRSRRPRATCCARSTTSCSTGPRSARSSRRSTELRASLVVERTGGRDARPAAHARRSCGCSRTCRRTSRCREIARAAVRLAQHRQLRGRLDLPQARCLVAQRSSGAGHAVGLLGG